MSIFNKAKCCKAPKSKVMYRTLYVPDQDEIEGDEDPVAGEEQDLDETTDDDPEAVAVDATGVAGATIQLVSLIVSKARASASEEKSAAPEGGPSASRITEEMLAQKEAERSSGWLSLPTTVTVAEHESSV